MEAGRVSRSAWRHSTCLRNRLTIEAFWLGIVFALQEDAILRSNGPGGRQSERIASLPDVMREMLRLIAEGRRGKRIAS